MPENQQGYYMRGYTYFLHQLKSNFQNSLPFLPVGKMFSVSDTRKVLSVGSIVNFLSVQLGEFSRMIQIAMFVIPEISDMMSGTERIS